MKRTVFFATLIACAGLQPATSHAADGTICFSPILTHTQTSNTTGNYSTTFPQIDNNTRFTCRTSTGYTLGQLMQQGWILDNMLPVAYASSASTNTSTGTVTVTSKSRWQAVIRKP